MELVLTWLFAITGCVVVLAILYVSAGDDMDKLSNEMADLREKIRLTNLAIKDFKEKREE